MRHQRLNSVVVEVFTSTRSATLALSDVNVLVGANGAGKSNFIRALSERADPERLSEWLAGYSLGELWEKNRTGNRLSGQAPSLDWVDDHLKFQYPDTLRRFSVLKSSDHPDAAAKLVTWPTTDSP